MTVSLENRWCFAGKWMVGKVLSPFVTEALLGLRVASKSMGSHPARLVDDLPANKDRCKEMLAARQ